MNDLVFPTNQLTGLKEVRKSVKTKTLSNVLNQIPNLYQGACTARLTLLAGDSSPLQRSWRGMLVGAEALVKLKNGEAIKVRGYNTKRTQKVSCPTRRCAEERILAEIHRINKQRPVEYIIALIVVGDFQVDDSSGRNCTTLHPCGNCRRKLELDEFLRDLTLIVTAQPPDDTGKPTYAEIHTRKDLIGLHQH